MLMTINYITKEVLTIKIIILDDQQMFSEALAHRLNCETDIKVEKTFTDAAHLTYYIDILTPDIVICEVKSGSSSNIKYIRQLLQKHEKLKFMIVANTHIEEYKIQAYAAGASAFISKTETMDYLIDALRKVYYFNRSLQLEPAGRQLLTVREREILSLIARDMTNKEISEQLFVSKRTVEYQVSSLIRKLEVESRVGAVLKGIKLGIIEEDEIYD